jgi:hypothetical protein
LPTGQFLGRRAIPRNLDDDAICASLLSIVSRNDDCSSSRFCDLTSRLTSWVSWTGSC